MATGVVTWSQNAANNATADSNVNWAEGMAPSQVNDSARAMMASVAKYRDDATGSMTTTGGGTSYAVTTNQGFSSLSELNLQTIVMLFNVTCGSSPTLSVDGLAPKAILVDASTPVGAGMLRAFAVYHLLYINSLNSFIVHNGHSLVEPGRIAETSLSTAPSGWLMCNGQAVSRTTYADLYAFIGGTYGNGDGSTTFNVPNRTGRVAVGLDASQSVIPGANSLGATPGAASVTLASGNMPQQTFTPTGTIGGSQTVSSYFADTGTGQALSAGAEAAVQNFTINGSNFSFTGGSTTIGNASPAGVSVIQPTIAMNFMIKT